ncbi:putative secreted protein [Pseudonocardia sp. Ae168_Ps1]|uniref:C40 family peptidase n=1 Tax=unclassified Pseudonocardia TaxID=2619320 RepID=UPI00094AD346|nr:MULTISPECIES: NlpC/P60 family protein [unclassified Pseudonocardia]OLL73013.1 putative secreted protein [Pseudonocardia sp. Ae150A_Ps1]OLL78989.1 putative secreted protein [Pseudonocardia sp. Ae168_Ps1]OLL86873.1 putative secreted protein [Pseudonocardia sp. Ae263_Ps1]OLL93082.1 putative secreted protein [Pseudonocardia sp. Ae356_Ps1]
MTTALRPGDTPDVAGTEIPRRRRDRDATAGISASELLARYSDAGFDAPTSGGRRAARENGTGAFGPAIERIDTPPTGLPVVPGDTAGTGGSDDTVVTRDVPAGVTSRSAVGLVRGTSETGPFGTRPRAVAATMSATLVGATAVMGVVTSLGAPDDTPVDPAANMDLAQADNQSTMQLSVPAAGSEQGGPGTSEAASSLSTGLEHVTSAVPQAFEQADAARIAAVAKKDAEEKAAEAEEKARSSARDGAGSGEVSGDPVTDLTGSANGLQALAAAKTKLGTPYQWGATGPSAFDCSGLMVWAFEKVGVDLPRTSSAQAEMDGESVSKSDLKPGDVVFFYSPVSHVGIYAGNGKILHASTSGEPVKYSDIDAMPFNSAVRV